MALELRPDARQRARGVNPETGAVNICRYTPLDEPGSRSAR
jgi:hypothetical protein